MSKFTSNGEIGTGKPVKEDPGVEPAGLAPRHWFSRPGGFQKPRPSAKNKREMGAEGIEPSQPEGSGFTDRRGSPAPPHSLKTQAQKNRRDQSGLGGGKIGISGAKSATWLMIFSKQRPIEGDANHVPANWTRAANRCEVRMRWTFGLLGEN